MDDIFGNDGGVDHLIYQQHSLGVAKQRCDRRCLLSICEVEKSKGQNRLLLLEFCVLLRHNYVHLCVLLLAHCACHTLPGKSYGKPCCLYVKCCSEPVQSDTVQCDQNDDFWPTVLSVEPLVQCVVCRLSVTFCIVAKRCVLAKKCLKE